MNSEQTATLTLAFDSGLGRELAPLVLERLGQSGFSLLQHGPAALLARAGLADLATQTLDVQYYIYEDDLTGILLTKRILDAADRGVQVRLLLDGNNLRTSGAGLRQLAAHQSIGIRVFNPFRSRSRWLRLLELAFRFRRLQRRMHNKIFVVDGVTGIFGGRNIGDNYFDAHQEANFADFDVLVAGGLIGDASASFESYWQHPLAVPIERLGSAGPDRAGLERLRGRLRQELAGIEGMEERYDRARIRLLEILEDPAEEMTWAEAEFIADAPGKLEPGHAGGSPVRDRLFELWTRANREVLIESAYFVPRRRGAAFIMKQATRGVRTRQLTHSLAANDVSPVHVGYAKYRRRLLKAGVELYEFRRQATRTRQELPLTGGRSDASLHAKVAVFDRRVTWVGSFNLDPRSSELNTELAIVIHSEELAAKAAAMIERDLEPDRAWQTELLPRAGGGTQIVWRGLRDDRMIRLSREPDATWLQRAIVNVLKLLPSIESIL